MRSELTTILKDLRHLSRQILGGQVGRAAAWRGADILITDQRPPSPDPDVFYPPPRVVVTRYCPELSWLFERLRDSFMPVLDGTSKIEFFGRLSNAANRYLRFVSQEGQSPQDLLLAVLHEAHAVRDEMDEGTFRQLLIVPGNTIWDDLVDRGEASGYLGPEETRRFFEEMERKHGGA